MTTILQPKPWTWSRADALLREYGDALYLVDLQRFAGNCETFVAGFRRHYPNSHLGYSYKTNYTPAICRKAHAVGCYAEVVSRMELDLAFRLGIPGDRVIFNGPVKSADDLHFAADHGVLVNIDNQSEIELLEQMRPAVSRPFRVGLRCNFPLKPGHCSRFGFDTSSSDFGSIVERVRRIKACRLVGLHCHFSHHRDADSYRCRAEQMVRLARDLFSDDPIEFLDIGGGFCGTMPDELKSQFSSPPPSYAEYADAVAPIVAQAFGANGPELILEPGMGVVADCMQFMTTVTATKVVRGKRFAVTTGSVYNVKPTMNAMNLPVIVLRSAVASQTASGVATDIVGFTCMEVDVMYRDWREPLHDGDIVIFGNVGAYTTVMLPPFIRPAPAMIAIDGANVSLIRRRQTMDDVLASYVL